MMIGAAKRAAMIRSGSASVTGPLAARRVGRCTSRPGPRSAYSPNFLVDTGYYKAPCARTRLCAANSMIFSNDQTTNKAWFADPRRSAGREALIRRGVRLLGSKAVGNSGNGNFTCGSPVGGAANVEKRR